MSTAAAAAQRDSRVMTTWESVSDTVSESSSSSISNRSKSPAPGLSQSAVLPPGVMAAAASSGGSNSNNNTDSDVRSYGVTPPGLPPAPEMARLLLQHIGRLRPQFSPEGIPLAQPGSRQRELALARYRRKRKTRNFHRPVDRHRQQIALVRRRNAHGHFVGRSDKAETTQTAPTMKQSKSAAEAAKSMPQDGLTLPASVGITDGASFACVVDDDQSTADSSLAEPGMPLMLVADSDPHVEDLSPASVPMTPCFEWTSSPQDLLDLDALATVDLQCSSMSGL